MKGYDFETGGWQSGAGHFTQVLVFIYRQLFLIKCLFSLMLSTEIREFLGLFKLLEPIFS